MDFFNFKEIGIVLFRLLLSMVLGGILGAERGKDHQNAGMRTYMLVAIGAATVMMSGEYLFLKYGTGDPARMGAQVISGIGFLGAGSIIVSHKSRGRIRGLTTAAGLWTAACLGLAAGTGFYEASILGTLAVYIVMKYMKRLEYKIIVKDVAFGIYMEVGDELPIAELADTLLKKGFEIEELQIGERGSNFERVIVTLNNEKERTRDSILKEVEDIPGIHFAKYMF